MTKKHYENIVFILNQMNENIKANETDDNYWETQTQKELMDSLANLFGANLNMFYENFDNSKFQKAYNRNNKFS